MFDASGRERKKKRMGLDATGMERRRRECVCVHVIGQVEWERVIGKFISYLFVRLIRTRLWVGKQKSNFFLQNASFSVPREVINSLCGHPVSLLCSLWENWIVKYNDYLNAIFI